MASDEKQFNRALAKWDALRDQGAVSVPSSIGKVAIVCSYEMLGDEVCTHETEVTGRSDLEIFRDEASDLADLNHNYGRGVDVVLDAKATDLEAVLSEMDISDVIIIGQGSLSDLTLTKAPGGTQYDWSNVAEAVSLLKQGLIVQRFCGTLARELNVPFGLFAVNDHRNNIAPIGEYFAPVSLVDPSNFLLKPVSNVERLMYADVKARFSRQPNPVSPTE